MIVFDCDVDIMKYTIDGKKYEKKDFHARYVSLVRMHLSKRPCYKDDPLYGEIKPLTTT